MYNGTGGLVEETVWLGDIPVATLRPSGSAVNIFYVHTDHLNTPRKVSRPSDNQLEWRWDADPFGTAAANQNPAGLGVFTYNLRFPGQYYQAETGLNQNVNRDYDPLTGKYIESDPIGLKGGVNTYVYALQNPILYSDPKGLEAVAYMMHHRRKYAPSGCERCKGVDRFEATVGGGCAEGDIQCAMAFQAAGFKGPFWPQQKAYSWGCLVSLGIGVKATGYVGSDLMVNSIAEAIGADIGDALKIAGWEASVFMTPLASAEVAKKCECHDER